ncbi:MAG: protoporphyrinogen oxidase [Xanthomonadales bacterium]|nr:protoporphyrinogen oxidase [Xanthomonadales bacterium]
MKIGIVGAGISGLATAQAILLREPGAELVIFEAGSRTGGKVFTEKTAQGYLCEWGVNAFLDKSPRTLELCSELGISALPGDISAKKRYVYSEGALHQLPEKPPQFFTSRLLSVPGRLRVVGEIFSGRAKKPDETLEEFGTRHLGREAFEKLIDPMASGVFAGDARNMSLKSCFPRINEVETEYGSLIRGLITLQIAARKAGKKDTPGPGPGGMLTSFDGGMSEMTDTLAALMGQRLRLNAPVSGISRQANRYSVHLADGGNEAFDSVVLACPAYAQAAMLADLSPLFAELIGGIAYPPLSVVCLGYERGGMGPGLDGFGFLVPSRENRGILGTVVDSNVFPNRAPQGRVLLRTMVGGARVPAKAELPDDQLMDLVRSDLRDIMGIESDPEFASIYRHQKAIPQYRVGHAARLEAIDKELEKFPGLVLTGNAYRGVSLNDCVLNAQKTAGRLVPAAG